MLKDAEQLSKDAAEEYNNCLRIDLGKKLIPIYQSVDEMLTRLEEFETLLTIVQQERCNAVGLTGSLTHAMDSLGDLQALCGRVDALEKLIEHIKSNVDMVERKVEVAEEQFGLTDNAAKLKNLLIPLFKKSVSVKEDTSAADLDIFSTDDYFFKEQNGNAINPN